MHVDSLNKDRETALHWAAGLGQTKASQVLLEAGADPSRKDRWARPAAAAALERGHYALADMLRAAAMPPAQGAV